MLPTPALLNQAPVQKNKNWSFLNDDFDDQVTEEEDVPVRRKRHEEDLDGLADDASLDLN